MTIVLKAENTTLDDVVVIGYGIQKKSDLTGSVASSNESFFKNNIDPSIISFGKIRASWGQNGNVNVLSNYSYTAGIATNGQWYQYGADKSITKNAGKVKNNGVEIELSWRDHIGDFKYGIAGNVSFL